MMTALLAGIVFIAVLSPVPHARADHETVPWRMPQPLLVQGYQAFWANVYYSGNHRLYTVAQSSNTSGGSFNLSFLAESDAVGTGAPQILYSSQPNDQVGGVGTATFTVGTGLGVDAQGRVYVGWVRDPAFTGGGNYDIDVSTSLDQGHTWTRIVRASAASDLGADFNPVVRVAPNGRVWVAYLQAWGRVENVTVAASSDAGVSFPDHWNATGVPAGEYLEALDFAIDGQGRLHLVYSVCTLAPLCSLGYTWSDDGATWSAPVFLVDGSGFTPPFVAWDPSLAIEGSTLHVDWYDSRETPTGWGTQYYARSADRGETWSAGVPISQGTSPPFSQGAVLAAFGDTVMAVWGSDAGLSWAVSSTGGLTWSPEVDQSTSPPMGIPSITVDPNGTFHVVAIGTAALSYPHVFETSWDGPPDAPTRVTVAPAAGDSLRLNWTAPPQGDVATYDIWRSPDGSTYILAGTVNASNTSWTDTGLADGTYWYKVTAVDATNHESHDSSPVAGTVGPAPLQGELNQILATQNLLTLLLIVVLAVVAIETFLLLRMGRPPKKPQPAPEAPKHPEDEL